MAIPMAAAILGSALIGAFASNRAAKKQASATERMAAGARAEAEKYGALAEETLMETPLYETPESFLQAFDIQTGAYQEGVSRLGEMERMFRDRAKRPLSGYAEAKLDEGVQRTEQTISKLARTTGTRDIYALTDLASQQASEAGAMAEEAMLTKEAQLLDFLPQAMQMEQGLSAQYAGAFQTMGQQEAMEQQSLRDRYNQLFQMYASAATGQSAFAQNTQLAGLQAQATMGAAQTQMYSDMFTAAGQAGLFEKGAWQS